MNQKNGKIKHFLACAAILLLLTVSLCACTKTGNETDKHNDVTVTPADGEPTGTPTPTFGFRDPSVTDVDGYTETGKPKLSGQYERVWNLAHAYSMENCVKGTADSVKAMFRVLWDEDCLYVQVHVLDRTPDTAAEDVYERDSVFFFINEDAGKNRVYSVGDAFYVVDRAGRGYLGAGTTGAGYKCISYEDGAGIGYYVEVRIPLLIVTGRYDRQIGFDIRVNNAEEGKTEHILQWADTDTHTDATLKGVGILTLD